MIALILAASLGAPTADSGGLIRLADAKRAMAAAEAAAATRKVPATIAIVDRYGELVLAQAAGSIGGRVDVALAQARATVDRDPSIPSAAGETRPGAAGTLLIMGGKVVGAIGDVGVNARQITEAGAEALK